jgi:hypothetical protein
MDAHFPVFDNLTPADDSMDNIWRRNYRRCPEFVGFPRSEIHLVKVAMKQPRCQQLSLWLDSSEVYQFLVSAQRHGRLAG